MPRINIKLMSINEAYKGKRISTDKFLRYEKDCKKELPDDYKIPLSEKLEVNYVFGVQSKSSDYDNYIKNFQDILQRKYKFNDKRIYKAIVEKIDVPKGEEYIEFEIYEKPELTEEDNNLIRLIYKYGSQKALEIHLKKNE